MVPVFEELATRTGSCRAGVWRARAVMDIARHVIQSILTGGTCLLLFMVAAFNWASVRLIAEEGGGSPPRLHRQEELLLFIEYKIAPPRCRIRATCCQATITASPPSARFHLVRGNDKLLNIEQVRSSTITSKWRILLKPGSTLWSRCHADRQA
ncbi:hypothetical protein MJ579_12215 [Klebsiella pneumoniae]|nr:hypothetical protein MJ579_12215 [Klebsiella pneumoniae]